MAYDGAVMFAVLSEARYYVLTCLDRLLYGYGRQRVPESMIASKQQAYLNDIRLGVEAYERASGNVRGAMRTYAEFIYQNVKVEEISLDELRVVIDEARAPLEHWAWKRDDEETKRQALHFSESLDERFDFIARYWSGMEKRGGYIGEAVAAESASDREREEI